MGRTIDHFMWGYQDMFRIHVEVSAESALNKLDNELHPEVFLVGLLEESRQDRFPACVEPEKEHWIESQAFNEVHQRAATICANYVESQMHQSHPLAEQRQNDFLYRRSIRDAILQVIEIHQSKPRNRTFFASIPELVDGYSVSVVLSVNTEALNAHHRLKSGEVNVHPYRTMPVSRSLIDAAITEILSDAAGGLLMPEPGLRTRDREADEVIRSAGRHLAIQTAYRVNRRDIDGFQTFYESCDKISSLKYEQAEGHGRLLLAAKDKEGIKHEIVFADGPELQNHRRARKLLELCAPSGLLHTDSKTVFGLSAEGVSMESEDVYEVVFLDHRHWELRHAGELLMGVHFGQPYLPKSIGYEVKLKKDLPRIFPGISVEASDSLLSLVRETERARHGTLLVVSADAASESERLKNQSTTIAPCLLSAALLEHLTGIDGAVLVDPNGYCHAIGVILDGFASTHGDPARGARYNSALRYVHSAMQRGIATLALVVSEDGGVDVIPNPPPAIKRSLLLAAIVELEEISKAQEIPNRRYNELYDWLNQHQLYLLEHDCQRVNTAIQEVERRYDEEGRSIWITRHVFVPDIRMDPAFFYEPEEDYSQEDYT
jgi:hypothetical protein